MQIEDESLIIKKTFFVIKNIDELHSFIIMKIRYITIENIPVLMSWSIYKKHIRKYHLYFLLVIMVENVTESGN